jgi:hypothetical protein
MNKKKQPKRSFNSLWLQITLLVCAVAILGLGVFWNYQFSHQIDANNETIIKGLDSLKSAINANGFTPVKKIVFEKDSMIYQLKEKDLQNFEQYINYLVKQTDIAAELYRQQTQTDIDRLNLYLTVGIGLLAFIGIILPLALNFLSKENLEEKQVEIEEDVCDARSRLETIENEMNKVVIRVDQKVPKVAVMVLHQYLVRLFDLTHQPDTDLKSQSPELLKDLKDAFIGCMNEKLFPEHDSFLRMVLNDFAYKLKHHRLTFGIQFSRELSNKFDGLANAFSDLASCSIEAKLIEEYKGVIDHIKLTAKSIENNNQN